MILCAGFLAFYGEYRVCRIHDLSYQEHFSDADNIYHHILFLYAISRIIQNISFNTPYDLTTRIKSLICKITRFYMKIFVTRSYGTLNGISMIFSCMTRKKIIPTRFRVGILFTYLLS